LEKPKVLIDAVAVAGAGVENVEGGVEEEGEFEVSGWGGEVWGEEGDVERVVLWRGLVG